VVDVNREEGAAVIIALMASALLLVMSAAVVLTTAVESGITAGFRSSSETFYAADAVLELAVGELRAIVDWNRVLDGSTRSAFVDGGPGGPRTLADGSSIDLGQIVSLGNCQKVAPCTENEMNAVTAERPWGVNNPRWQLYAYGRLSTLTDATQAALPATYVVVLVADDPAENDGDPMRDGGSVAGQPNPGLGVLTLRSEAFGPRGAFNGFEMTISRAVISGPGEGEPGGAELSPTGARILTWRRAR
jgi:hypothetical protein